jgi:hypothetical protein
MGEVAISVGPVIAGLVGLDAPAVSLPLPAGGPATLRDVVALLESRAPGALIEPRTGSLHRYIHARVNGKPAASLAQSVSAGDRIRLAMRMIESG